MDENPSADKFVTFWQLFYLQKAWARFHFPPHARKPQVRRTVGPWVRCPLDSSLSRQGEPGELQIIEAEYQK